MKYLPELKNAMAEIEAIIKKYDVGAMVLLHKPGFTEYKSFLQPSYSILTLEPEGFRFKTKGQPQEKIETTYNLISHFAEVMGNLAFAMFQLMDKIKAEADVTETDSEFTSGFETDN